MTRKKTRRRFEKKLVLLLSPELKQRLDGVLELGYTLNGFTRCALQKALDDLQGPRRAA